MLFDERLADGYVDLSDCSIASLADEKYEGKTTACYFWPYYPAVDFFCSGFGFLSFFEVV